MTKEERFCIDCGKQGVHERKRCKECSKIYNRKRQKILYQKNGKYNYGKAVCPICNKEMTLWRKGQVTHATCRASKYDKNDPEAQHGRYEANKLLNNLNIKKPEGYQLHHVDENPLNNNLSNLVFIKDGDHQLLHRFLQMCRSLWLKNHSSNPENCWDTLRDHLTTTWLEITGVKVIKISDIGQSAAELLNQEKVQRLCTGYLSAVA